MPIQSVNPATGEVLKTFAAHSDAEVERRIGCARTAFEKQRRSEISDRSEKMLRAADILDAHSAELARTITLEMGKPIRAARDEIAKCAKTCRFYAEHAKSFLADEEVATDATRSFIRYEPLGTVLAVMPWNFPFWQVFRFAAPALMAGNTGLLKHASNVPQCALAIEKIFRDAGLVEGTFQTLLIDAARVEALLSDPRIAAVTLTGSEPAGRSVAGIAGAHLKKSVLELGGSDPFIVMPSADFASAVATGIKARTNNNGQSCIAAKRFILHEAIAEKFTSEFVRGMEALKIGDPLDESTEIGPLATAAILNELEKQVEKSVASGARILTGGRRLGRPGNYFPPTVIAGIPPESPVRKEEFFGPVALFFTVQNIDEAIAVANETSFGLGSSAWTNDDAESERFISEIEAGQVFINSMVASDPQLPFGGVKNSGFGRELSACGIREFVNIKTVFIKKNE
jgi:succinate-semialdehyde dehydrogenase/glutarate-semialdehyde dehydrogenase